MKKLKVTTSRLTVQELISLGRSVVRQIAPEPPEVPPYPDMEEVAERLRVATDEADEASKAYQMAVSAAAAALSERNAKLEALRQAHRATAAAVEVHAKGEAAQLAQSGYGLSKTPVRSKAHPERVENLVLHLTDFEGQLRATWEPVRGALIYEIETSPDGGPEAWQPAGYSSASNRVLKGLPPGERVRVRVRAVGRHGTGAWSDPAVRRVA